MSAELARAKRAADVAARRNAEAACALDFLVYGDDEERGCHSARCVHGPLDPCSRSYDPLPYPEAEPADQALYEGTGIGALYGVPGCEGHEWQLAGWNLTPRSTR
jgi:hypothetical protein